MALCTSSSIENVDTKKQEEVEKTYQEHNEMLQVLPKAKGWMTEHLLDYQGYWLSPSALKGVLFVQQHFKPNPTDIFLATSVKCGTTWFRALMFATINRSHYAISTDHPLMRTGPHDCFPFLDAFIYQDYLINNETRNNVDDQSPRLFATHFPYALLPKSMTTNTSTCKFVYVCREPKDVLISKWHFMNNIRVAKLLPPLSLHEAHELFCQGVSHYGPYWNHVLGYWKASFERPDIVFFVKYEDMKREPTLHLKRLASFLGQPFSVEEEAQGLVQKILELCSFENLKNLEVNKSGILKYSKEIVVNNNEFFRKGEIGDWENHLSDEMVERLDGITEHKFKGSGLTFGVSPDF